ncbi:sensor histidine kinase [Enterococcus timonensis]|uniref:sensor histidine kinase n=1 Tax=Enterococcus timonensis TaxID=1852364 RepID=UPI0008D97224|nr:sensor histidine kinase [Enterococcus timonensis]
MKYLYQQLLAFWSLIVVVLLIVGISFVQFTRRSLEENNYSQLFGYAVGMQENYINLYAPQNGYSSPQEALLDSLSLTESVLAYQNVQFYFVNADQQVIYPMQETSTLQINAEDWAKISDADFKGQIAATTKTDLFGRGNETSYIMKPFYTQGNDAFAGALIVSQPAQNIENTLAPLTENLFKAFIISSIVALLISYWLATAQVRRINRLKKATNEIAAGNFEVNVQVNPKRRDEFEELANDFNHMAQSLADYRNEVEEQEERRIQFMADASHEMRTPLTTINGLLEGLSHNAIPEERKEKALHLMENETKRLIRLVNENLDYEKIRTNQISMVIKAFDGNNAVDSIVTQMQAKAKAAGNQIIFEPQEDVTVYADYDRFIQMLVNIIQNAIQFTTDGLITIRLENISGGARVSISDTGIGMSEEQQKNIWDRYFKVDPSRKNTKFGESGLGLPIVQQLVTLHNGKISVNSKLGEGTTFTIDLPDHDLQESKKPVEQI